MDQHTYWVFIFGREGKGTEGGIVKAPPLQKRRGIEGKKLSALKVI